MSDNPHLTKLFPDALTPYLIDEEAPFSFALQAPSESERLFVLLDRSSFVLGRTRDPAELLTVLVGHLAALLPPPDNTVRFRLRALANERGEAVVALPPFFTTPPLIERRLKSIGHRLVDRLVIDINENGCLDITTEIEHSPTEVSAHVQNSATPLPVTTLVAPGTTGHSPSKAQLVHALASTALGSFKREDCLTAAEKIASATAISLSPVHPEKVYSRLKD